MYSSHFLTSLVKAEIGFLYSQPFTKRKFHLKCVPFWVIPRRLSSNSRRFRTHFRFHLHRQVNEVSQWMECVGYLYLIVLERGITVDLVTSQFLL